MAEYCEGTVLTCTHEHRSCRVLIQSECHGDGVTDGSQYTWACGAPLVPVGGA
jgi:hypothetical protein